jgi:hypothetical protein
MKVRGSKIAEWHYGDSTFAVIRLAAPEEGEYVTPGSDQADAVLRLEAIAERLQCNPEYIEERINFLLDIEAERRREWAARPWQHPDPEHEVECSEPNAKVQAFNSVFHWETEPEPEEEDMPPSIRELIEVAEDMGFQLAAVIGGIEEIEEFIAQLEGGEDASE